MISQQPNVDNAFLFEQLWGITNELRQKLDARFTLHSEPSTKSLQSYSAMTGEAHGSLNTFSGEEIDWLVHSWLRDRQSGFCNMHLTIWLRSPKIKSHLQNLNTAWCMEINTTAINSYRALAFQVTCHAVNQASNRQQACSLIQNTIQYSSVKDFWY